MWLKPGSKKTCKIRQLKQTAIYGQEFWNDIKIAVHFSERICEMQKDKGFNPIVKKILKQ